MVQFAMVSFASFYIALHVFQISNFKSREGCGVCCFGRYD